MAESTQASTNILKRPVLKKGYMADGDDEPVARMLDSAFTDVSISGSDYDEIVRTAMDAFPDATVHDWERTAVGANDVFYVDLRADGELESVVLKCYPENKRYLVEKEVELYRLTRERTSLPVPEVLDAAFGPHTSRPYFVMERLPGENYSTRQAAISLDVLEQILYEVGVVLGEFHEIENDQFGFLVGDDGLVVDVECTSWADWFRSLADAWLARLEDTRFAEYAPRITEYVADNIGVLEREFDPVLVHHDVRLGNLLVRPTAQPVVTGVLDWEMAYFGHAEHDLVRTEFMFIDRAYDDPETRTRLRRKLYEGYRTHQRLDTDGKFDERRQFYRVCTLTQLLQGFDRHYEDATEDVRREVENNYWRLADDLVPSE